MKSFAVTDDPAVTSPVNHSLRSLLHFNSLPPLSRQKPSMPAVTAAASDKGTISSVRRPSFFHLL